MSSFDGTNPVAMGCRVVPVSPRGLRWASKAALGGTPQQDPQLGMFSGHRTRNTYNGQMSSIFLLGFMASGKTTLARVLAKRCNLGIVDLDETIEEASGESVAEIIRSRGECVFRELEYRTLRLCPDGVVISAGGGCFVSEDVRTYLRESGILSIFLDLPWECLARRAAAQAADRPLWKSEKQARRLFESRIPLYKQADIILKLEGHETPEDILDLLLDRIPEYTCAT